MEKLELNHEYVQEVYWVLRQFKKQNQNYYAGTLDEDVDCLKLIDNIDSLITRGKQNIIGSDTTYSSLKIHIDNLGVWDSARFFSDDRDPGSSPSAILMKRAYISESDPTLFGEDSELRESFKEYDSALGTFARRCSRFIMLSHQRCVGEDYIDEVDLNRIDMAIAMLEVRRAEVLDYLNYNHLHEVADDHFDSTLFVIEKMNAAIENMRVEINQKIERLEVYPDDLNNLFSAHLALPANYGVSFTHYFDHFGEGWIQLGFGGSIMMDGSALHVQPGVYGSILSQRFGMNAGIVYDLNGYDNPISPMASLLFREGKFVYGFHMTKFYQGISVGASLPRN